MKQVSAVKCHVKNEHDQVASTYVFLIVHLTLLLPKPVSAVVIVTCQFVLETKISTLNLADDDVGLQTKNLL